ncbi:GRIP and coiled-coil domain-containing protein 2-like [Mercenaria mercenaria]|uniref:GRIP and coiled-coil domain-containing protein 2-like n=1 Tax=Mercenaria mercenaria TaxID=6596 RepID=UPI00234F0C30|nr:GRIP and coiled-coil domain-containing protein 2-like [Mercenaria mercenaria]
MEDNSVPEDLRLNSLTSLVFNASSIRELKYAVVEVFDIFYDIVTEPINCYADLKKRLTSLGEKNWDKIRKSYLQNSEVGYCNGDFTEDERNSVVKILLDFVSLLDKCSQSVFRKVEEKQNEILAMEGKVNTMEERIRKMDVVIESQKTFYTEKIAENSDYAAQNMHLLQQISEKNKQITELERNNNQQLWEKEKQKLLKESTDKITQLEREIENLQQQNESYKIRLSTRDSSYKQLRIKNQLQSERLNSPVPSSEDSDDSMSTCKLSQKNYMQDKDIVYLEKKLYDLQTTTCGVIGGMKTDFKQLAHKFIDPEKGQVDENFKVLSARMDRVYKAVAEAEVEKVKEVLPPHYKYLEDDNFKVKKIRRLSQPIISPSQRMLNSALDEKKPVLKPIPPSMERQSTLNGIKEVPVNPVIIDPVTKKLHPINPLKYFPFISQQFLKDQYEKFKQYDTNGDGTLDLKEMTEVVKELGFAFNVHQLQEAMEEVDRDGNQTLDFFEYMLIIDNIYRKRGKAELFQQGMKEVRKNNMSKSCVIQ